MCGLIPLFLAFVTCAPLGIISASQEGKSRSQSWSHSWFPQQLMYVNGTGSIVHGNSGNQLDIAEPDAETATHHMDITGTAPRDSEKLTDSTTEFGDEEADEDQWNMSPLNATDSGSPEMYGDSSIGIDSNDYENPRYFDQNYSQQQGELEFCFSPMHFPYLRPTELPMCESANTSGQVCAGLYWSCQGRCHYESNQKIDTWPCACKANCLLYDSCCEDFSEQCPAIYTEALQLAARFENRPAVCSQSAAAMLISHCPKDYSDASTRSLCEQADGSTAYQLFPVTDSVSTHHFRNVYCWQCWTMPGVPLPWSALLLYNLLDLNPSYQHDLESILAPMHNHPHNAIWTSPTNDTGYMCEPCAVSDCLACTNAQLHQQCSSINAYVEIAGTVYKNAYCFECAESEVAPAYQECGVPQSVSKSKSFAAHASSYNYFEFIALATFKGDLLKVEQTNPDYLYDMTWTEIECRNQSCLAQKCRESLILNNGRCDGPLRQRTLMISGCLSDDKFLPSCSDKSSVFSPVMNSTFFSVVRHYILEKIEDDFEDFRLQIIDMQVDMENLAVWVNYSAVQDLAYGLPTLRFRNTVLVSILDAMPKHHVPDNFYICFMSFYIAQQAHSDPHLLRPTGRNDCFPVLAKTKLMGFSDCSVTSLISPLLLVLCWTIQHL